MVNVVLYFPTQFHAIVPQITLKIKIYLFFSFRDFIHRTHFHSHPDKQLKKNTQNIRNPFLFCSKIKVSSKNITFSTSCTMSVSIYPGFQYSQKFTLLSNTLVFWTHGFIVSIPSEFTLLSNRYACQRITNVFQYPLNLHCSQTRSTY